MTKIGIVFATWGRLEIGERCLQNCIKVAKNVQRMFTNTSIEVFCIVSEPDWVQLCLKYDVFPIMGSNENLGRKFNSLFFSASNLFDWFLHIGSDDFISEKYFAKLINETNSIGLGAIGTRHFAVLNHYSGEVKISNYNQGRSVGVRMYNSEAVRKVFADRNAFWPEENIGLDGGAIPLLQSYGYCEKIVETEFPAFIDVKSEENLHSYDSIRGETPKYMLPLERYGL